MLHMGYLRRNRPELAYAPWDYRPRPNDYGADFESIVAQGYGSPFEELPVDQVVHALAERGLPYDDFVVDEIVEGCFSSAIEAARDAGDVDGLMRVLRSTPDFEDDALDALMAEAMGGEDEAVEKEEAFLSRLFELREGRLTDGRIERVVHEFAEVFSPSDWQLVRSRCSGFPAADWARARMDSRLGLSGAF